MMSQSVALIWDSLVAKHREAAVRLRNREPLLIVIGREGSGKSSLISSFVYKGRTTEAPKPTAGFDYKYTRTSPTAADANPNSKVVSHFWEIGGGRSMVDGLAVVLGPDALVAVVVDLSKPNTIVSDLLFWLPLIGHVAKSGSTPVPAIVIIANKQDAMVTGPDADLTFKTIRAIALQFDAMVVSHSLESKVHQTQMRAIISRFIVNSPMGKTMQSDPSKPLMIPPGNDSFDLIGTPPHERIPSADKVSAWCTVYRKVFPDADIDVVANDAYENLKLEPEPVVDALWLQKREEFKRMTVGQNKSTLAAGR